MNQTMKTMRQTKPFFKYVFILFWICLYGISQLNAQDRNITGNVKDATGTALPGVNVFVKGTSVGAVTNLDGNFSIKAPGPNAILMVTYIGYKTQEIEVGEQSNFSVVLEEDVKLMDEIVVVGYGVQKKKLVTGANAQVKGSEIEKRNSVRLEQALQGMSSGVQIISNSGQPGSSLKVRIRGVGTVGSPDPIYIVDGVPTSDIGYINPSDVESIDVLKDAASAAIYGARAANGVVLITTKKGKAGNITLSYDGYYGIQNVDKKADLLNKYEYAEIQNEIYKNLNPDPNKKGYKLPFSENKADIDTINGTNWVDQMFRENVPTQSHAIGITGGNEKSQFSSSISYFDQKGIVGLEDRTEYKRYTFRINSEHKLYKDYLKIGQNLTYTRSQNKGIGVGNIYDNSIRPFLNVSPTFPVYDTAQVDGYGRPWKYLDEVNPLASLYYRSNSNETKGKLLGNVYAELEIIKGLKLKTDFGAEVETKHKNSYSPVFLLTSLVRNDHSRANQEFSESFSYNFENTINYVKNFGSHEINALIGTTIRESSGSWLNGSKEDLLLEGLDYAVISNGTNETTKSVSGSKWDNSFMGQFGRLLYNYDETYLFSATLRRDGSSKFGPDNKYGYFPSVSGGVVLTKFDFVKQEWLDFLKVRASWGQNGNDGIDNFAYVALIQSTERDYYFGKDDSKYIGSSPSEAANKKVKWETSEQTNLGLDATFLQNFNFAFDYYVKTTKDWLLRVPVLDATGYEKAPYSNGGKVENKGYEMSLIYSDNTGAFTWSLNGNFTYNKNEVLEINNEDEIIHGQSSVLFNGHDEYYRAEVGQPVGFFYGYKTDGVFQNAAEIEAFTRGLPVYYNKDGSNKIKPGDVRFVDTNGDTLINEKDKVKIGDPWPDFTYGLTFTAGYKGFDFSMTMQGIAGNQLIKGWRAADRNFNNYSKNILERWHGEGTSTRLPRVTDNSEFNKNYKNISDLYVEDGDYLKIRSVNLGYDFASSLLKGKIAQFRIYASVQNLFTFTQYSGMEPEVGWSPEEKGWSPGHDIGFYP